MEEVVVKISTEAIKRTSEINQTKTIIYMKVARYAKMGNTEINIDKTALISKARNMTRYRWPDEFTDMKSLATTNKQTNL